MEASKYIHMLHHPLAYYSATIIQKLLDTKKASKQEPLTSLVLEIHFYSPVIAITKNKAGTGTKGHI